MGGVTSSLDDLDAALARLDRLALSEPRLEVYRVLPMSQLQWTELNTTLNGRSLPDEFSRLFGRGGFWPGGLRDPIMGEEFEDVVGRQPEARPPVRWLNVGTVWERDHFYVPVTRVAFESAPLGQFSSQMLTVAVIFPSLAALLESFILAIEILGLDNSGWRYPVDPVFVDLVCDPPRSDPSQGQDEVRRQARLHDRLRELAESWSSEHPCWSRDDMPMHWTDDGGHSTGGESADPWPRLRSSFREKYRVAETDGHAQPAFTRGRTARYRRRRWRHGISGCPSREESRVRGSCRSGIKRSAAVGDSARRS